MVNCAEDDVYRACVNHPRHCDALHQRTDRLQLVRPKLRRLLRPILIGRDDVEIGQNRVAAERYDSSVFADQSTWMLLRDGEWIGREAAAARNVMQVEEGVNLLATVWVSYPLSRKVQS
jgi:hypothetical protein